MSALALSEHAGASVGVRFEDEVDISQRFQAF
jgi:hypothetical protein